MLQSSHRTNRQPRLSISRSSSHSRADSAGWERRTTSEVRLFWMHHRAGFMVCPARPAPASHREAASPPGPGGGSRFALRDRVPWKRHTTNTTRNLLEIQRLYQEQQDWRVFFRVFCRFRPSCRLRRQGSGVGNDLRSLLSFRASQLSPQFFQFGQGFFFQTPFFFRMHPSFFLASHGFLQSLLVGAVPTPP